jgi:hypothetical protein
MSGEVCGNDYDKAFRVITSEGREHVFDSIECMAHVLAPLCSHCHCRILGHGMEKDLKFYCCAHCAASAGVPEMRDRSAHAAPV